MAVGTQTSIPAAFLSQESSLRVPETEKRSARMGTDVMRRNSWRSRS